MNAKNSIRWLVITASGGYGIYSLINFILNALARVDTHWAGFWFFLVPFALVYSGLFMAVAYFVFRRQYRHLGTLVSTLTALVVFSLLSTLIRRIGFNDWLIKRYDSPWVGIIGLPLSIAALLIPFYGARWAFRRGQAFLARFIHDESQPERAA